MSWLSGRGTPAARLTPGIGPGQRGFIGVSSGRWPGLAGSKSAAGGRVWYGRCPDVTKDLTMRFHLPSGWHTIHSQPVVAAITHHFPMAGPKYLLDHRLTQLSGGFHDSRQPARPSARYATPTCDAAVGGIRGRLERKAAVGGAARAAAQG